MNDVPSKAFKKYDFKKKTIEKKKENCNSYGFIKILWSNSDHSKVPNYDLLRLTRKGLLIQVYHFVIQDILNY
jgi:hypothetical protein